jgi:DNA-binding PadR family transcriptional regulator
MQGGMTMDVDGTLKLSKRLSIGLVIFDEIEKGNKVYFNNLVDLCKEKGIASRATVSLALDSLYDSGILRSKMEESDGYWKKYIHLTNEGSRLFKRISAELKEMGYKR